VIKATEAAVLSQVVGGMIDLIFLMLAFAFVVVATLAALATTSASPMVRVMANKVVNGSAAAFLLSVALAAWFFVWPPESNSVRAVGFPPQLHSQNSSGIEGTRSGDALGTR
jgi:hypothetical protein